LYAGAAGTTFNNAGTLKKSSGTGSSSVAPVFNNTGSIQADTGTISFQGSFTQSASGSTVLGGGSLQFNSSAPIPTFQGGSLSGSGTATGSLTNSGANLAPGTATTNGTITLGGSASDNYTQSGPGSMTIKIGGSSAGQFDQVVLPGTATLGGTLNLVTFNGYTPPIGTQFTVMTFASATGTFSSVSAGWSAAYNPNSVVVTFHGGTQNATISPTQLTFATQVINTTAKAKTITVTNNGTLALYITGITIIGPNAAEFAKSSACGVVNPGAKCTISVTFTPSDKGTRTATVQISDDAGTGTQSVPLTGVGTYLNVTPSPIAFPSQSVGTTSNPGITVTLQNVNTTTAVNVTGVTITGTQSSFFSQNSTCALIAASSSCSFTVTFTPQQAIKYSATLQITEDGGGSPLKIAMSGSGTYVTLSPSPVAFGAVSVGSNSSLAVTLTNNSPTTAITVSKATMGGTNKADFSATLGSTCSSVAAAGGTCTITVKFTPKATGSRTAIMSVTDTDPGSPQSDVLTGTGQ
jgi:hypothetical protein